MRKITFWPLAISFATIALDHGLLITHLLPLLDERWVDLPIIHSTTGVHQFSGEIRSGSK